MSGSDSILRQTALAAAILVAAMLAGVLLHERGEPAIAAPGGGTSVHFSHAKHVGERGLACADCHEGARTSVSVADRLVGGHESCQSCHEEKIENDCASCHVDPDNIVPAAPRPTDLVFSHALHAGDAGISCETCHGSAAAAADGSAEGAGEVHLPAMAMCVDCHSTGKAANECETCHRDFVNLVPGDHLVAGFVREHDRPVRTGAMEIDCATCHRESFCQECHAGDQLRTPGGMRGLQTSPGSRTMLRTSPDALRLQAAHDLNYRYTHAVEARARASDCASCHDQRTFCAECHQSAGVGTGARVKPASHLVAGFVTIGTGTGGGEHARMGRRDIESCVSCHDVEGRDPSCILCHGGR